MGNYDFEHDLRMTANEAVLSTDVDEAADHLRRLARRVEQAVTQSRDTQIATDRSFRQFLAVHSEDLLDDPVLLQRVEAREQYLLRAYPGLSNETRWERAANDVRKKYGTADQRVIRGMRQARLGARLASDTEDYKFDTGNADADLTDDEHETELANERSHAIMLEKIARMGRRVDIDKDAHNEAELRRRQRNA